MTDMSVNINQDSQMPKVVDRKEKSRKISDVALKVFRARGYTRTRMIDIAEAAGIGKGTIYEYFRNKADILRFAFDDYFEVFRNEALSAIAGASGPAGKLIALVDFSFSHIDQWEDHCIAYLDYVSSERSEGKDCFSLANLYDAMDRMFVALISEGQAAGEIDPGIDPNGMAKLLICIYDGIILHHQFESKETDRQSLRKPALALLTGGLLTQRGLSEHPQIPGVSLAEAIKQRRYG